MHTLRAVTQKGPVGTVTLHHGQVSASTPGLQDIVNARLVSQGSPQAAFWSLYGWSSGYLWFEPDPDEGQGICVAVTSADGEPTYVRAPGGPPGPDVDQDTQPVAGETQQPADTVSGNGSNAGGSV